MGIRQLWNNLRNPERLKRNMFVRELFLKLQLPFKYPYILNIEPTNACNLVCSFCPRDISGRKVGFMPLEFFQKICDEAAEHGPIFRILLQKDGESLIHPDIDKMIAYAKKVRASKVVSLISNGIPLNRKMSRKLIEAGLDDLTISIDAVEPKGYAQLKGPDEYQKVVDNIHTFLEVRREMGAKKPFIEARMVHERGNEAAVERFTEIWQGVVDKVDITPYHTWLGSVEDKTSDYARAKEIERYPCALLWYTGVINWDGKVSLCCIDYACQGIVGDLNDQTMYEVWNSPEMNRIRRAHVEDDTDSVPICSMCNYWQIKENIGPWLKRKPNVTYGRARSVVELAGLR